ncbi:MAG TPA: biotin synthase BioB, partial [Candidatus Omnitrophota bacterium]|nr:biotin synthase BioB [Candidatus Omnitrophota bacterium]
GNRLTDKEIGIVADAVREIKRDVGMIVCASLGELSEKDLKYLKQAGLSPYHHNIETSRRFFPKIVTSHTFDDRIRTIKAAKNAGLEVCSGGIIGLGETMKDRIDMAVCLKDLNVDSVPVNILVAIKGTFLEGQDPVSCQEAIRTLAIFRIILKDKTIKVAAGRETILKDFQGLAFMAGANGMLIGGYLTIKGRTAQEDNTLIREIADLWKK